MSLPNEALRAGDVVQLWCGTKRITRICPYDGPLRDVVFALAEFVPGPCSGFSLERGGYTDVVAVVAEVPDAAS